MRQATSAESGFAKFHRATRKEKFLAQMEELIPWRELCAAIEPHYPSPRGAGRRPLGVERMLRIHFMQRSFEHGPKGLDAVGVRHPAPLWRPRTFSNAWKLLCPSIRVLGAACLWLGLVLASGLKPAIAQDANVCSRTQQVRSVILAAVGESACSDVTAPQLRDITSLDLSGQSIVSLSAGDFDDLHTLKTLDISGNTLASLPAGLFDELYLLRTLHLKNNRLATLPTGIFDQLLLLKTLSLTGNSLSALPEGMFDGLSRFKDVHLGQHKAGLDRLRQFIAGQAPTTVEAFIEALPALHKERFVFVYDSDALGSEFVSTDHPRVISYGADARLVFSWQTNPDATDTLYKAVEFLIPADTAWVSGVVDFSGDEPEITHPDSCQTCHGPKNKPLFTGYDWPGTENLDYLSDDGYEREQVMLALRASTNSRIAPLDLESADYSLGYGRRLTRTEPSAYPYLFPAEEASLQLAMRHGEQLLQRLKSAADYAEFAEEFVCFADPTDAVDKIKSRFYQDHEHSLAHFANSGVVVGGARAQLYASIVSGHYDFRTGTIPGIVRLLVLRDFWNEVPEVRALYRRTSNEDLPALSGPRVDNYFSKAQLLIHPVGGATAEDELIQLYRWYFGYGNRASLISLDLANNPFVEAGRATSDFEAAHTNRMAPRVCVVVREKRLNKTRPHALEGTVSGGKVLLGWNAPTDDTGVTGYRIKRGTDENSLDVLFANTASTATSFTDTSVTAGSSYRYSVTVLRGTAVGDESPLLSINVPGQPPRMTGDTVFTVVEGATAVATLTATDEDTAAADLTWSISSGAAGGADAGKFTLSSAGVLSFAAAKDFEAPDDADTDGSYRVTVRVSDGGHADTADLTVALTNRNEAPTANAGADQADIEQGATVSLSGSGADPDAGNALSFAWTQTGGTTVTLSGADSATAAFTAPSGLTAHATLAFSLKVTDTGGLYHEDPLAVTVVAGNPLTAAFQNAPLSHDGSTAFDVRLQFSEEVSLSYTAFTNGLLTITGGTLGRARRLAAPSNIGWEFSVTPSGDEDVVITLPAGRACNAQPTVCTPDGQTLSAAASVTVAGPAPAESPEITGVSSFTVVEGATAVATLTATDGDTAAAELTWSIPSGAAGGADAGKFTLSSAGVLSFAAVKDFEAPDDADTDGSYRVTVRVSDGGLADTQDLTVALTNRNEAPTANAGADQADIEQGAAVSLPGSGTDPDAGDTLSYDWTQTGGTTVTLSGADTATAAFTAPSGLTAHATLAFSLKVTDTGGLYHEDTLAVTVDTPLSDDATLSSLTLSGIDIGTFDSATPGYAASVDSAVSSTRVTAEPNDTAASVVIADSVGSTSGTTRQVSLEEGANTITVTVTAENGITVEAYTVTVTRANLEPTWGTRLADKDIESDDFGYVTGLWGQDSTLWVFADGWGPNVLAFDMEGNRDSDQDLNLASTGGFVTGIWSDGETIWAAIYEGGAIAYALDDGTRLSGKDLSEMLTAAGNDSPAGIWSDQETIWVADYFDTKLYAYRLSDNSRLAAKEFSTMIHAAPNHTHPRGVWSDGEIVLISDWLGGKVRAFQLSDGTRVSNKDIDTADAGNVNPTGLWSDGETLWVGDDTKGKVYAYAVPGLRKPATDAATGAGDPFTVRVVTLADAVPSAQGAAPAVFIPDEALRQAVAGALGLAPGEAVDTQAMAALRALSLRGARVAELAGLEYAVNLEELDLGLNPLTDLGVLALLPRLRVLNVDGVARDLRPLTGLVGLERLSLRDNSLVNVTPLASLTELKVLDLAGNRVTDPASLAGLWSLRALRLDGNPLRDVGGLAGLVNLRHLSLRGTAVSDIGLLKGLAGLETLDLGDQPVEALPTQR